MKTCNACGYHKYKETNKKENISFHIFPMKENIRQEWIKAINRKNFIPTRTSVLCSQHFSSDCFYYSIGGTKQRIYLKPDSIPTIFGARFSRKLKMSLRHNFTDIDHKSDHNIEESSTMVQFRSKCLETGTTESSIDTEITSCADDTINDTTMDTCQMELEDTYKNHPETPKRKLIRQRYPRYFGDCALSDLQSSRRAVRNWNLAMSCINMQRKKLAAVRQQNYRFRKRITNFKTLLKDLKSKKLLSDDAAEVLYASLSESSRAIFKRTLKKNSRTKFPPVFRTFATTLQFYSSAAYNYVRKTFMNSLPHPATIRRWYHNLDGTPGITNKCINTLKLKIREANSEGKTLYFNLVIDEMSLKRQLDWDGKRYTGFVDLGTDIDTDELPQAQYALVFLVTCLNAHYKIPIAYYFIHSLTGAERANLLKQCLLVHEAKIHITSITLDGAASNIAMLNIMGANLTVKDLVPYFNHPVTKVKVFILLDACHMLKLVRNALVKKCCGIKTEELFVGTILNH